MSASGYKVIGQLHLVEVRAMLHPVPAQAGRVCVQVVTVLAVRGCSTAGRNPALEFVVAVAVLVGWDDLHGAAVVLVGLQTTHREVQKGKHASEMQECMDVSTACPESKRLANGRFAPNRKSFRPERKLAAICARLE